MAINNRIHMLGVPIDCTPLEDLVEETLCAIRRQRPQIHFACANPHSLVTSINDSIFKSALCNADMLVADGSGVALMARATSLCVPPRITGHDFFLSILESLNRVGAGRIFFLGSSRQVLDLIKDKVSTSYPGLTVVGTYSPPFSAWDKDEEEKILNLINEAAADVLWVGMTAPKQEKWVFHNREALNTPVIGSIGAVFDFYAGTHPRAPAWMRKYGLEWLYRLAREPRRLWKRNIVSTPRFIISVIRERLTQASS